MNPRDEWNKAYTEIETGLTPAERQEILDDMRRRRDAPAHARLWPSLLRWFYRNCTASWIWLDQAPFPIHFSLRVSMLTLSILLLLPTRAGSIIASFGGSLAFNLIYAAIRRWGTPSVMLLLGLGAAPFAALLAWGFTLIFQVVRNALKAWKTPAWDFISTRQLLIAVGLMLAFMTSGLTGVGSLDGRTLFGLSEVAALASLIVFTLAGMNEILLRALRRGQMV